MTMILVFERVIWYIFYGTILILRRNLVMNCNACGAPIPDGAPNCPNCGQAVANMGFSQPQFQQQPNPQMGYQQPNPQMGYQQPNPQMGYQQPMGGYQQPYGQPQGGYYQQRPAFNPAKISSIASNGYMKLVSIIGALLIYHAPVLSWLASGHGKSRYTVNLFDAGRRSYLDSGVLIFFGVAFMVIGAILILMELSDYIPAIGTVRKAIPYTEIIMTCLVVLALLFWFLAFFNGDILDSIDDYDSMNHGVGPIIAMIGIVLNAFVRVINLAAGKRN
jgi:hypothetical protein